MIYSFAKRIFILKHPKSNIIEEAIFIIKDKNTSDKFDILTECERIVEKQNRKIGRTTSKHKAFLASLITMIIIVMILVILYAFVK